ncbi:uncharacterized protein LOC144554589 isoform X2 [Carex rostrata]
MAGNSYSNPTNSPLTNILLNGKNYLPWARAVTVALGGKSKIGHVTGTTSKPTADETKINEWQANDHLVMNWLFNSMHPEIYDIFSYSETAAILWTKLKEMYGRSNNVSRVFELQQNLAKCKKEPNQSVTEHLGKMTKQWEELRLYRPVSSEVNDYIKREEQDRILLYLASLGSEFEEARRSILLRPELPSFNTVCSIIQSEEDRSRVMSTEHKVISEPTENSALNVVSKDRDRWSKGKGKGTSKFYCDHCRRDGHSRERCWVLHPHLRPNKSKPHEVNFCADDNSAMETNRNSATETESKGADSAMEAKLNLLTQQVQALLHAQRITSGPETVNAVKANGQGFEEDDW